MSKQKAGVAAPSTEKKYSSAGKRRAVKDFGSQSINEKIASIVKKARIFAGKKGYEGIEATTKTDKAIASSLNPIVKPKGRIDMADEATISILRGLAKDALSEMKSDKYGSGVKALLNYCLTSMKSAGGRGFNASALESWDL